jgi:hypothetical protein
VLALLRDGLRGGGFPVITVRVDRVVGKVDDVQHHEARNQPLSEICRDHDGVMTCGMTVVAGE